MLSDAQKKAEYKYRKSGAVKSIRINVFPKDHDVYEHYAKQERKAEYIIGLIRADMSHS